MISGQQGRLGLSFSMALFDLFESRGDSCILALEPGGAARREVDDLDSVLADGARPVSEGISFDSTPLDACHPGRLL